MKLLYISTLFPNHREPVKGIFNAQQVQALSKFCRVTVIAPTAHVLPTEEVYGARVLHPKFLHLPVVTRPWNGWLYACAIEPVVRAESFDIAFASFAYPDGAAVMKLAKRLHFPFTIDVLGSDINVLFEHPSRRSQILCALRNSDAVFAKSRALADSLAAYGIQAHIDYNGIDRSRFYLRDRQIACQQLKLAENRRRILYVGNLHPVKGPQVLAAAFEHLRDIPDVDLVFIGAGPEAAHLAVDDRVQRIGTVPHNEIANWMSACDLLCLPSRKEGLPNVVLEAMGCGRAVVASNVGGVPEAILDGFNGFLVPPGNVEALAAALHRALITRWDPAAICKSVARFDWDKSAQQVYTVLQSVLRGDALNHKRLEFGPTRL